MVRLFQRGALLLAVALAEGPTLEELEVQAHGLEPKKFGVAALGRMHRQFKAQVARGSGTRRLSNSSTTVESIADDVAGVKVCLDYMWLLVSGALVMFMQAGFAILEAGSVRSKNAGTVMLKNLVDVCLGTIAWYVFGYGISYGVGEEPNRFTGTMNLVGNGFLVTDSEGAITGTNHFKDWFFQWAFCATAATIVSGGVAERIQFTSYVLYSAVMTGIIYPFIVYWTWSGSGWLTIGSGTADEPNGYSDFAGSGIVHLTGGIGAAVGAICLGARRGRWTDDPANFAPHNLGMVVLGTFILWFGWYGFNCGSTLAFSDVGTATQAGLVAMNTTLAAAAGGLTVLCLRLRKRSYDVPGMCNGILAGLVAVCAGVGDIEPGFALFTGVLGGMACEGGSLLMQKLRVDDPLDAFAVHGCGGACGVLLRPLLDRTGSNGTMLGWHIVGLVSIIAWTAVLSLAVFLPMRLTGCLRADEQEEVLGADIHLSPSKLCNQVAPDVVDNNLVGIMQSLPSTVAPTTSIRSQSPVAAPAAVEDALGGAARAVFDDRTMGARLPADVFARFKEAVALGRATSDGDRHAIARAIFEWARELGATDFAHWFFPCRGGGGAVGGSLGALKMDSFIDLRYDVREANKPFELTLPSEALFQGETDGSSFPNGGLRCTHSAAAFTTWDRSSPPFVLDKVLRVPCSFVTHFGKCIDDKTPLLRSMDAVQREALTLLKAIGIASDAKAVHSYLGWEQEFFIVPAEHFKARPDLINCGRTLFGSLPARHQQAELNYFGPVPRRVEELMRTVSAEMLRVGCPMKVRHNEVAPGQHEMSPIFSAANVSADTNVLFMEVLAQEAGKLGLQALFHEKPFAGINGSGKHANWSIGTDTGLNFFHPGKTEDSKALFVSAIACLAYGLCQHNELVRCSVAHAGNDHRLGAQEAPPAIISLFPGIGFEEHVDHILQGGKLSAYKADRKKQGTGCRASMDVEANVEDRNRTAPFPFCGNRFEFRAVGSSQNCAFPVTVCNTVMAAGMAHLSKRIQNGQNHREAVAAMLQENKKIIFTGNGYSADWPREAASRGLPNLDTTPKAIETFSSTKNQDTFEAMKVLAADETRARAEVMYESYVTTLEIEATTMVQMVETGILPACARDLANYGSAADLIGDRLNLYKSIKVETDALKALMSSTDTHETLAAKAAHLCDVVKPHMGVVRGLVDKAEGLLEKGLYPYPSYSDLLYSHHH